MHLSLLSAALCALWCGSALAASKEAAAAGATSPYAVSMEPMVPYSQRDPLYHAGRRAPQRRHAIAPPHLHGGHQHGHLHGQPHGQPHGLLHGQRGAKNRRDAGAYGAPPPQQHYEDYGPAPEHHEYPEPIIEIIIKESNESLPAPPPLPVLPPKKPTREPVHVFYVKYKQTGTGEYGKDGNSGVVFDDPIPALTPAPPAEEEEEHAQHHHQHQQHYEEAVTPAAPRQTTTLRAIIHPDSELAHPAEGSEGKLRVTFGGPHDDEAHARPSAHTQHGADDKHDKQDGHEEGESAQRPVAAAFPASSIRFPSSSGEQGEDAQHHIKRSQQQPAPHLQQTGFNAAPNAQAALQHPPPPPPNHQPGFQQHFQQGRYHQQDFPPYRGPPQFGPPPPPPPSVPLRGPPPKPQQPAFLRPQPSLDALQALQNPRYPPFGPPPALDQYRPRPADKPQRPPFQQHDNFRPNYFPQPQPQQQPQPQPSRAPQFAPSTQHPSRPTFQRPAFQPQPHQVLREQHQQQVLAQQQQQALLRQQQEQQHRGHFSQYSPQQPQQSFAPQQPQHSFAPQQPQQSFAPQQPQQPFTPQQPQQQPQQSFAPQQPHQQPHPQQAQQPFVPQQPSQQQLYREQQLKQQALLQQQQQSAHQQHREPQPQQQQFTPQQSRPQQQRETLLGAEIIKSIPQSEEHVLLNQGQYGQTQTLSHSLTHSNQHQQQPQHQQQQHQQHQQQQHPQQSQQHHQQPHHSVQVLNSDQDGPRVTFSSSTPSYSASSSGSFATPSPSPSFSLTPSSTTPRPTPRPTTTTTTTEEPAPSAQPTTEAPKIDLTKKLAQLPDEVPDDIREQLISSGILGNADIQILDYDKIGDTSLDSLPAHALENFYANGGGQAAASEPVASVVAPPPQFRQRAPEPVDAEPSASEIDEVVQEPASVPQASNVEMKVVRYDPATAEGQQVADQYLKKDAAVLNDPVVLNDNRYNRYLPLKISGAAFPLPDAPLLRGRNVTSVVVLAPVDYDFLQAADDAAARVGRAVEVHGVRFVAGDALKKLVRTPTQENYRLWLQQERQKPLAKQSVILLVTSPNADVDAQRDKEIFMYDASSDEVSRLTGELSSSFVEVAESNALSQDLENVDVEGDGPISSEEAKAEASERQEVRVAPPEGFFQRRADQDAAAVDGDLEGAASDPVSALFRASPAATAAVPQVAISSGYARTSTA